MTPALVRELRARVESVAALAEWHADLDADPADQSPEDTTAHVNGLIIQECQAMLAMLPKVEP